MRHGHETAHSHHEAPVERRELVVGIDPRTHILTLKNRPDEDGVVTYTQWIDNASSQEAASKALAMQNTDYGKGDTYEEKEAYVAEIRSQGILVDKFGDPIARPEAASPSNPNPGATAGLYDLEESTKITGGVSVQDTKVTLPAVEAPTAERLQAIADGKQAAIAEVRKWYAGQDADKEAERGIELAAIEKKYKEPTALKAREIKDQELYASYETLDTGEDKRTLHWSTIENRGKKIKEQIDAATPAIQASIRVREAALAAGKSIDEAYDLGAAEYTRVLIHNGTPPKATEPPVRPVVHQPEAPPTSPNSSGDSTTRGEAGPEPTRRVEKERLHKKLRRFGKNVLTAMRAFRPGRSNQTEHGTEQTATASNVMPLTSRRLSQLYQEHGFTLNPDDTEPILDYLNQRLVNVTRDTIVDEFGVERLEEFDKLPKTSKGEKALQKWIEDNMPTLPGIIDRKFKEIMDGEDFAKLRGVFDGSVDAEIVNDKPVDVSDSPGEEAEAPVPKVTEPILIEQGEVPWPATIEDGTPPEESILEFTRDELVNELGFDGPVDQIQPILGYLNDKVGLLTRYRILTELGRKKLMEFERLPKSTKDEDAFYDWIEDNMHTSPDFIYDIAKDVLRGEDFAKFIESLETRSTP